MKITLPRSLKCVIASIVLFGLTACSLGKIMDKDSYPAHHFSFDTLNDSPDIDVVDYQYSNSRHNGVRPERERVSMGQYFCCENIYGSILRGDFLYVKWRVKKPGALQLLLPEYSGTYEDKVDLKSRLPADITNLRVHFVIRRSQLYVYLIWPGLKDSSVSEGPVKMYDLQKQVQIYPDLPK